MSGMVDDNAIFHYWSVFRIKLLTGAYGALGSHQKLNGDLSLDSSSSVIPQSASSTADHHLPPQQPPNLKPQQTLATMAVTCGDIPRLICSVIIPPVGVFFQCGCNKDLAINILLTLLGYIPGLIHAIIILIDK